jgi:hypothetical protein
MDGFVNGYMQLPYGTGMKILKPGSDSRCNLGGKNNKEWMTCIY